MARFDVNGTPPTYLPSAIVPVQPELLERSDGSWVRSNYWYYILEFFDMNELPAAAFEEWAAFCDGTTRTIVLPPPDDVAGGDETYTVYIRPERWPRFVHHLADGFSVRVGPILF